MADPLRWVEALAGFKALYDVVQFGTDYATAYIRHRNEPDTIAESERVSAQFSSYSNDEVEEITRRIEDCRKRFTEQFGGKDRARCMCSIFREVMDGQGGTLPTIDDWRNMFDSLKCTQLK